MCLCVCVLGGGGGEFRFLLIDVTTAKLAFLNPLKDIEIA